MGIVGRAACPRRSGSSTDRGDSVQPWNDTPELLGRRPLLGCNSKIFMQLNVGNGYGRSAVPGFVIHKCWAQRYIAGNSPNITGNSYVSPRNGHNRSLHWRIISFRCYDLLRGYSSMTMTEEAFGLLSCCQQGKHPAGSAGSVTPALRWVRPGSTSSPKAPAPGGTGISAGRSGHRRGRPAPPLCSST